MKTKTAITLLFCLGFFFNLSAQTIIGPSQLCLGEVGEVYIWENGQQSTDQFVWIDNGSIGSIIGSVYPFQADTPGTYEITATDLNGTVVGTLFVVVDVFTWYIEGPSELCVGECGDYILSSCPGVPNLGVEWMWAGLGLAIITNAGAETVTLCVETPGVFSLQGLLGTGDITEYTINASLGGIPEIISLSGGFCASDSLSNCDRVCENTTVTYTTPINNPSTVVNWSVSGAESWVDNGNEVTVEWGDPGQGQVSVQVGNAGAGSDLQIYCSQVGDYNPLSGFAPINIFAQGTTPPPYNVEVNGLYVDYFGPGNLFIELLAGNNEIIVYDDYGNTASCNMFIDTQPQCGPFFTANFNSPADVCEMCESSITLDWISGSVGAPYTYLWSDGTTVQNRTGLCEGLYSVTISDAQGCTTTLNDIPIICPQTQSCSGANTICVDILEIPEAAFETVPPAVNGIVEICEGQTVFFDNQTNGAFNYTWDFGNGISSSLVDPEHTYLSAGTYEALLIARNDCFCGDTSSVTIIVEEAITPEIDCAGTICPDTEITYTSNADCSTFYWNISSNGTIVDGGSTSDDFVTVDWGAGPEGIIELSVDNCNGDYCLQTLVENIPIIDDNAEIRGPERVCKGTEVIYSMPAFAGTEFVWTVSSMGTITEGQGSNEITVQWANEVTAVQQEITVEYESCYLGCGGEDVLLVNILNEVFIEGPIEACPGGLAEYICQTPLGNSVLADWTVTNNSGTVVASSGAAISNYNINWNLPNGNYTVHAEVQNPTNYCIDNFSVFVEVVPETESPLSITGALEICPGTNYTYTGNSASDDFSYTWYVSDGGNNYILNGKTVNIAWNGPAPYTLALTQTNLEGFACESEPIEIMPTAINSVNLNGAAFICHEDIGVYVATNYENLEYTWQITPSDAGSIIEGENTNTVQIQWHTPGTHNLLVSVCGALDILPVTVHSRPNPIPVYSDVCPGQTGPVSLTLPYVAYDWRNENGLTISNSATTNLGTGYYEVIVTDNNGCTENETFFIDTYGQPDVTISTPDFGDFCQNGGSMTLYALESSSGPLDYQWFRNGIAFGANSSAQIITQEGTYYVMVTDVNGCTDNSNNLGLNCSSLPDGPPIPGCTPDGLVAFDIAQGLFCNESQYTNTSVNDAPNTWAWEFWDVVGGGIDYSNLENPSYTWSNAGFNLVIFRAGIYSTPPGQICTMGTFSFDTIPLAANFVSTGICSLEPVFFTDISTFIPQTNIAGWSWDFGDPASGVNNTSIAQNPTHIYNTGGSYTINLTVTDQSGCISVRQKTIEILDPPLASFTIPAVSCEGASVFFTGNGSFTDISWDFGDPTSGDANVSNIDQTYHVYNDPGVYTVTLSVENIFGCTETVTQQINVEPNALTGSININPGTEVCQGDSVILTAPLATQYEWTTGAQTQTISVFEAETYGVTIYDALGCGYTPPSVVIDIIPLPEAQITAVEYNEYDQPTEYYYNNYETCFGEDVFLEITDNPNYTYEWNTGDLGTEISFTEDKENLLAVGTHVITATVTDVNTGCTNLIGPFIVTVHPVPENVIIVSMPSAPVCENTPTTISIFNPEPTYIYVWNTGEVGTSINTFYAGKYFARAINEFGCEAESNTLEIIPGPNLDLIPTGCHTRCNPDTICLPPILGVNTFQWYFNGTAIPGPQGNDPDFIAMESGEYYVEMVSDAGCVTISDILTLDLYDGFGDVDGNVYFDVNENGLIDAADTLLPGIGVILQNGGTNLDTLWSDQSGAFSFANILSTDYELLIDVLNLPPEMTVVIGNANAQLVGCDDEATVAFLIEIACAPIEETLNLETCEGETIIYEGVDLNAGDTQDFSFLTSTGCDSIVTVTVTGLPLPNSDVALSACEGETVEYNGTDLMAGSITPFVYMASSGCDSTVMVNVASIPKTAATLNVAACEGENYFYNGNAITAGSSADFILINAEGCDSTLTVNVASLPVTESFIDLFVCSGESINYNGTELFEGFEEAITLTDLNGCDSIVTVRVEAYPVFDFAVANDASCWNERNGVIYVEDVVGGTGPFQYGVDGYYQDSTTFVAMNDGTYTVSVIDANGCEESLSTEISEITALEIAADIPEIPCDLSTVRLSLDNLSENAGPVSYLWDNGSIESFIEVDTPGVYTVAITNACEVLQKEYTVRLAADGRANYFYVPNVFSPNDDGMNDLWKIMPPDNMEVLSFELQTFDRWGNHLKTFETINDTWDGTFKSEMLDSGVYVWWYRATVISCGRVLEVFESGDVTVVR